MNKVQLHYYISNNGDGSASVRLCKTAEEAAEKDEEAQEMEGWGESSNGSIELTIKDGKIFYEEMIWNPKKKKHDYKLIELLP